MVQYFRHGAAFHQVPVNPVDVHKTAFVLPNQKYEYLMMPFGLIGAPWTFSRLGMEIFEDILADKGLVLFIDDLCMYSPTFSHHYHVWRKVLERLRRNNLKLKPTKTHLFSTDGLTFLGHHISSSGISPNPSKQRALV